MDDTRSVSVLIRSGNLGDRLPRLVGMLDDQVLPYSRYEVIFLDPGSSDGTSDRVRNLVGRRPNVQVITPDVDGWRPALEAAAGEFVLCLGDADLLLPDGLATLLEAAEGKDVVVAGGGDAGPVGFVPDSIDATDAILLPTEPASGIRVLAPFALIRRELLLALRPDQLDADTFRRTRTGLLASSATVAACGTPVGLGAGPPSDISTEGVLGDVSEAAELLGDSDGAAWLVAAHAAAILDQTAVSPTPELEAQLTELVRRHWKDRDPAPLPPLHRAVVQAVVGGDLTSAAAGLRNVADLSPTIESSTAEWSAGALRLAVSGTVPAPLTSPVLVPDHRPVRLTVRSVNTGIRYDLPTDVSVEAVDGAIRFVACAALDVTDAAAGGQLTEGVWQVLVRLVGTGSARAITIALPGCTVPGGVVDGIPVSVFPVGGQLRLDVGARQHGLLSAPFTPDQAKITESAQGAVFSIADPHLAVRGGAALPGALYLGSFRLPAVLRSSESGVSLECHVSGLAGVSKLEAQIGRAQRQPLGLQLRIAATGEMSIEPAAPDRPATKKPAAKKPAIAKPGSKKPAAKKPAAKKPAAKKSAGHAKNRAVKQRRSRRIVDRLPGPLRPVARTAARSPLLQRAYQRLRRLV